MRSFESLKNNRDYIRAYRRGTPVVTPCLAIYCIRNNKGRNRVGLTASKKIGNAVKRNRAKRIMRAAADMIMPELRTGYDFVLVSRSATPLLKAQDIYNELYDFAAENNLLAETTLQ